MKTFVYWIYSYPLSIITSSTNFYKLLIFYFKSQFFKTEESGLKYRLFLVLLCYSPFFLNSGYTSSREENQWLKGSFPSESHISWISWNVLCQNSQNLMLARRWRLREGTSSALMKSTQAKSWKIKEKGCWKGQL